jgi:hypothetical protein
MKRQLYAGLLFLGLLLMGGCASTNSQGNVRKSCTSKAVDLLSKTPTPSGLVMWVNFNDGSSYFKNEEKAIRIEKQTTSNGIQFNINDGENSEVASVFYLADTLCIVTEYLYNHSAFKRTSRSLSSDHFELDSLNLFELNFLVPKWAGQQYPASLVPSSYLANDLLYNLGHNIKRAMGHSCQ